MFEWVARIGVDTAARNFFLASTESGRPKVCQLADCNTAIFWSKWWIASLLRASIETAFRLGVQCTRAIDHQAEKCIVMAISLFAANLDFVLQRKENIWEMCSPIFYIVIILWHLWGVISLIGWCFIAAWSIKKALWQYFIYWILLTRFISSDAKSDTPSQFTRVDSNIVPLFKGQPRIHDSIIATFCGRVYGTFRPCVRCRFRTRPSRSD